MCKNEQAVYKSVHTNHPLQIQLTIIGAPYELFRNLEREVLGSKNQSIYIFEAESQQSILLDRLGFRIIYQPFDAAEIVEEVKYRLSSSLKQGIVPPDTLVEDSTLIFSSAERYFMIDKNLLVRAMSAGNYTTLFLRDNKKVTVSKQLGKVLEMLPSEDFFRVHHSHVVNRNFILSVLKKNHPKVMLNNNTMVPVSRRKKKDFLLWLGL